MYLFIQHVFLLEGLYITSIILGIGGKAINKVPTLNVYTKKQKHGRGNSKWLETV